MHVYITFVCEGYGCKKIHSVNFDYFFETLEDIVGAMMDEGWNIQVQDERVTKTICPDCRSKETA